LPIMIDEIGGAVGRSVYDEYGRTIGVLVSINSDTDGTVEYVEIKFEDRGLERIPGERLKVADGKIVVVPEWKYNAIKVINALERAYKRKKGVEEMLANSDIPGEVIDEIKRKLNDQIKKLRIKAKEAQDAVKDRIDTISIEYLHVARAEADLRVTYFSGEIGERQFEAGMKALKKLKDALSKEKADAKEVLDKLSKVLELASGSKVEAKKPEPAKTAEAKPPATQPSTLAVKIVES